MIEATNGRLFSVTFQKVDGEMTRRVCRTGMVSKVKGTQTKQAKLNRIVKNCLSLWDVRKGEWITVKMANVTAIKAGGVIYFVK